MINQPVLSSHAETRSWLSWKTALIFGLAFFIYLPAIRGGFIWDDNSYVTGNAALRSLQGLWDIWFRPIKLPQYYPLTFTSLWINYQLSGLHPMGYHLVNVLLHALNSFLVWRLLERLKVPGAWFAGLLFLVHPVHVESVAWITERKNVLSGFFYLLAFWAYLRFKEEKMEHQRWYFISFALFLAALLSKTVAATFPAAVILTLWWKEGQFPRKDLIRMIPFLLSGMVLGFITIHFENAIITSIGGTEWNLTFSERLLIAGRAAWFYLGKLVWPSPLIFIYPRWTIDSLSVWQWLFPLSFMFLGFTLWKFRPKLGRGPCFAWALFGVTLFPALGFKNFFPMCYSFVADHFQYLASVAPLALGAVVCLKIFRKYPRIRTWLAAAVLVIFSFLTWRQCHVYKDLETLWRDTLKKNPGTSMAHNNLGTVLMESGRHQEAAFQIEEALRLNPENAAAYNNLGNLAARQNDLEKSTEYYRRALQIQPTSGDVHNNLGVTLFESGKTEEATEHFLKAIAIKPSFAMPYCNLGNASMIKGDIENAVRWYREALTLDPNYTDALTNLGLALFKLGQTDNAIDLYRKALELNPNLGMAHRNLAEALANKGLTGQAKHHILEAIRLAPENIEFRTYYAAFLEHTGKTDKAVAGKNQ